MAYEIRENGKRLEEKYQRVWDAVQAEQNFGYTNFRSGLNAYIKDPEAYMSSKIVDDALRDYDGRLFELDIPEKETMLDEQLTFDKQPPEVQKAIRELLIEQEGPDAAEIDLSRVTGNNSVDI